jgi:endogenous inhibitor of DNA gyrase (YacG/DUF329 family)
MEAIIKMMKKCPECGKEYIPVNSNQKYCSAYCGNKYRRIHGNGFPYEPTEFYCAYCKKHVQTDGDHDKRTRFCCAEHEKKYWRHPTFEKSSLTRMRSLHEMEFYEKTRD